MTNFSPPPTYADPVLVDGETGRGQFNPIWLKWFLDLTQFISVNGGGGVIQHNTTGGLQGGGTGEYFHLTVSQHADLTAGFTGTGVLVRQTSPSLVTPALGTPASGVLTNCTGLPISTGVAGLGAGIATWLATPSSANLAAAVTDETGTGSLVFGTNAALTNPTITNGRATGLDYIGFLNTPVLGTITPGTLYWDDGNGTLNLNLKGGNVDALLAEQEYAYCYNDSGGALTKGQVVYISGAQGNRIAVKLAQANNDANSAHTIGLVAEPIASGAEGWVQTAGPMFKLNTLGTTAGDTVYLSPTTPGQWTTTKPVAPDHLVIVGFVERVSATVGSIYIKVDNGYELEELHNVRITSIQPDDLLQYDSGGPYWKNVAPSSVVIGTATNLAGGAAGSVPYQTGVGATTFLSIGTAGQYVRVNAGATAPEWASPAALTKTDDTNVTLTLGGSASTALLDAASITVGWTGTLAASRLNSDVVQSVVNDTNVTGSIAVQTLTLGWTGQLSLARGGTNASLTASAGSVAYSTATELALNTAGNSGDWLKSAGTGAPTWAAPAALTKTDDTNVTLTLGGSASTALLNAASLTLGWTGTLAVSRGGTGTGTAFTAGSVIFAGASGVYSQDNANLFWDNANNRLGIGTAVPGTTLDVVGDVSISGNVVLGSASTNNVQVEGYMGVGGAPSTSVAVYAQGTLLGAAPRCFRAAPVFSSAATSSAISFFSSPLTQAATYTIPNCYHFRAFNPTLGAGSSITNLYGVFVDDQTRGTNNYGVVSQLTSGANKWNIYASGTANNYFAGNVGIGTATPNEVLDVNGRVGTDGVVFPATQVSSAGANTLDDYEEGTFTPTVVGSTTDGVGTYSVQVGRYTKIGRAVVFQLRVAWSAHTGTGNLQLGGLPFTSGSAVNSHTAATIGYANNVVYTAGSIPMAYILVTSTLMNMVQMPSGGGAMANVPIDAAGDYIVSGTYFTPT